jgi:hypothetical protein
MKNLLAYDREIKDSHVCDLNNADSIRMGMLLLMRGINNLDESDMHKHVVEVLGTEHRTLQQTFLRVIVRALIEHGENAREYFLWDDRNKAAVNFCNELKEFAEQRPLPLI